MPSNRDQAGREQRGCDSPLPGRVSPPHLRQDAETRDPRPETRAPLPPEPRSRSRPIAAPQAPPGLAHLPARAPRTRAGGGRGQGLQSPLPAPSLPAPAREYPGHRSGRASWLPPQCAGAAAPGWGGEREGGAGSGGSKSCREGGAAPGVAAGRGRERSCVRSRR